MGWNCNKSYLDGYPSGLYVISCQEKEFKLNSPSYKTVFIYVARGEIRTTVCVQLRINEFHDSEIENDRFTEKINALNKPDNYLVNIRKSIRVK